MSADEREHMSEGSDIVDEEDEPTKLDKPGESIYDKHECVIVRLNQRSRLGVAKTPGDISFGYISHVILSRCTQPLYTAAVLSHIHYFMLYLLV